MRYRIDLAMVTLTATIALALGARPPCGWAYPGGPLKDVTDAAPFCAGCHSSTDAGQLRDIAAERASQQLAANAHLGAIEHGRGKYAKLSAADRARLAADVKEVDANASVTLEAPSLVRSGKQFLVKPGQQFEVSVTAQGGAGPVVGVMILDTDLRNQARPIQGAGFDIVEPPQVTGPDGKPQDGWLKRRYDELPRNINFVVIFGTKADLEHHRFSKGKVTYVLQAPSKIGKYSLCAALLYGTEKASPVGRVQTPGGVMPIGGIDGASGRIKFSEVNSLVVK